jgi:hypothetical protein
VKREKANVKRIGKTIKRAKNNRQNRIFQQIQLSIAEYISYDGNITDDLLKCKVMIYYDKERGLGDASGRRLDTTGKCVY